MIAVLQKLTDMLTVRKREAAIQHWNPFLDMKDYSLGFADGYEAGKTAGLEQAKKMLEQET